MVFSIYIVEITIVNFYLKLFVEFSPLSRQIIVLFGSVSVRLSITNIFIQNSPDRTYKKRFIR